MHRREREGLCDFEHRRRIDVAHVLGSVSFGRRLQGFDAAVGLVKEVEIVVAVRNEELAAGFEKAKPRGERFFGMRKVPEKITVDDGVEAFGRKVGGFGVSDLEDCGTSGFLCVGAGFVEHALREIDPRHAPAEFRGGDGKESGTAAHVKESAASFRERKGFRKKRGKAPAGVAFEFVPRMERIPLGTQVPIVRNGGKRGISGRHDDLRVRARSGGGAAAPPAESPIGFVPHLHPHDRRVRASPPSALLRGRRAR